MGSREPVILFGTSNNAFSRYLMARTSWGAWRSDINRCLLLALLLHSFSYLPPGSGSDVSFVSAGDGHPEMQQQEIAVDDQMLR